MPKKLWNKNVRLVKKLRKNPDKRSLSGPNDVDVEGRPRSLIVDVTEMIVPEPTDSPLRIESHKPEIFRQH